MFISNLSPFFELYQSIIDRLLITTITAPILQALMFHRLVNALVKNSQT